MPKGTTVRDSRRLPTDASVRGFVRLALSVIGGPLPTGSPSAKAPDRGDPVPTIGTSHARTRSAQPSDGMRPRAVWPIPRPSPLLVKASRLESEVDRLPARYDATSQNRLSKGLLRNVNRPAHSPMPAQRPDPTGPSRGRQHPRPPRPARCDLAASTTRGASQSMKITGAFANVCTSTSGRPRWNRTWNAASARTRRSRMRGRRDAFVDAAPRSGDEERQMREVEQARIPRTSPHRQRVELAAARIEQLATHEHLSGRCDVGHATRLMWSIPAHGASCGS